MANAIIIFISLYVQLTSAYVDPASVSEFIDKNTELLVANVLFSNEKTPFLDNARFRLSSLGTDKPITKDAVNLESQEKLVNHNLNEYATEKENNVNERSFVIIDQRFKVPVMNQFYLGKDGQNNYKTFVSNADYDDTVVDLFRAFHRKYSEEYTVAPINGYLMSNEISNGRDDSIGKPQGLKHYKQENNNVMSELDRMKNKFQYASRKMNTKIHENKNGSTLNGLKVKPDSGIADKHLEYLEIMKPPLIKTNARSHNKPNDGPDIISSVRCNFKLNKISDVNLMHHNMVKNSNEQTKLYGVEDEEYDERSTKHIKGRGEITSSEYTKDRSQEDLRNANYGFPYFRQFAGQNIDLHDNNFVEKQEDINLKDEFNTGDGS